MIRMPLSREKMAKYMRNYWKRNPDKYEEHKKKLREKLKKWKEEIFDILGNKCVNPFNIDHGKFLADKRCLQIDHVNGDGNKSRKNFDGRAYYLQILREIKAGSKDYQILCANCNWLKYKMQKENN